MKIRSPTGQKIADRALFLVSSLGPVGWIGATLLALAAIVICLVVPGIDHSNAEEASTLAALNQEWEGLRDPKGKSARAQRDPVTGLIEALPSATVVPDFLASLQRRADQAAVQIDRTEYHIQPVIDKAAQRYYISFPAHVDYPHLRSWLEALLHDYPSLALDELSLHRAVDGGEELEAHVGLSLLVRVAQ
ncbi:MAG TPA: hypothetical protein VED85_00880 [Burkholderiaceae bacterium]|nr:hypothetical protein [Burkholderiaceae bacterium]